MASKMLDNACMAVATRSHEHSMRHFAAIIGERIPRQRGHVTIRFLHDQIGRGKIPVTALPTGKSRIQASLRNPA